MDLRHLLYKHLKAQRLMQLATTHNGQPWICSVYYVVDDNLNLYWLSLPERRHSRELKYEPRIAATIPIKSGQPVIGIQSEGLAHEVTDAEVIQIVMADYVLKYQQGSSFFDNFVAGNNKHRLYKFRPQRYVLFDEVNFKDASKELIV